MRKILLLFIIPFSLKAQTTFLDSLKMESEAGVVTATGTTPFLLRSNQYGVIPQQANFFYVATRLYKEYEGWKKWDYGFGLEGHINAGKTSQFLLPEAYLKGKAGALEIYIGRMREVMGLVDTVGTMGSYIWSGNALPVPKIDIGFRNFVPVVKSGLLSVKGNFAHGWMGNGDSVQNILLHQKSLYLRLGKPDWKIRFLAGVNHQVQWGGRPANPYIDPISKQLITRYDVSLENYFRVVSGVSIGEQTGLPIDSVTGLPGSEAGNRLGNHLGTIDIGTELVVGDILIRVYRQSIYDDGSLFFLSNISDGLTGISLSGKKGLNLCFEYLDTRNQGGRIYYGNIAELRGIDDYFNNYVYHDAWTYKGKTIGNPLLNPYHENPLSIPEKYKVVPNRIYNSRVQAFHIHARYQLADKVALTTRAIYSKNYGTYLVPRDLQQLSLQQTGHVPLKHFDLLVSLAADIGKYYPDSYGVKLAIRKQW